MWFFGGGRMIIYAMIGMRVTASAGFIRSQNRSIFLLPVLVDCFCRGMIVNTNVCSIICYRY